MHTTETPSRHSVRREVGVTTAAAPGSTDIDVASLLDPRCVATDCACVDATDALRQAAALLARVAAVTDDYADAVIAREADYPTGLPTEPVGVALPHADR